MLPFPQLQNEFNSNATYFILKRFATGAAKLESIGNIDFWANRVPPASGLTGVPAA
jgi:hypothetical protein